MGPIRNPNWSTSGMMVTLSYLVHTIYRTRGEHANHYATDAVPYHLTYTLVMGGAYPYMDLNAKYEKLYY
jgi:hypothetical protein